MTEAGGDSGAADGTRPAPPRADDPPPPVAPLSNRDRLLLGGFGAWVLLLLLAAFAQVTENRFLLDLFDLRRWFTR